MGFVQIQVMLFSISCFSSSFMVTGNMCVHEEDEQLANHWCQPAFSAGATVLSPSSHPSKAASLLQPPSSLTCFWFVAETIWKKKTKTQKLCCIYSSFILVTKQTAICLILFEDIIYLPNLTHEPDCCCQNSDNTGSGEE